MSALREAIDRTEVYEYMLFLTSGFGQPDFQMSKFLHACKLSKAGFTSQALDYCEIITTTIFCNNLLQEKKRERPEWLMELEQMLQNQTLLSSSSDDEEQKSAESLTSPYGELDSWYIMEGVLGRGGFGTVYSGVRKEDGKKVAIKCVAKKPQAKYITIPGETRSLPLEVALMEMVSKPPRCENVVELLEWFETPTYLILVMEQPNRCIDLLKFCICVNGPLSEPMARVVMHQVVRAACHCCERGVSSRYQGRESSVQSRNFAGEVDRLWLR
ncbi:LOW QUALITY PROTEIN: probable myosin light chain kinase DDB_G0282429 [Hemibagrus wyckioides]|uniref:LOW QUALITY PROTEIN: probable myosin light chain kinase DDB_G0282429 n=1 Tax=Hemibagrus wyckioides TaxID=337641 RepID=UPI00266B6519|nr:LOW QUALITY PROTEIN: probable myosin light chain kinase DDB_G0282429 [Hemibagrus wyckioides]